MCRLLTAWPLLLPMLATLGAPRFAPAQSASASSQPAGAASDAVLDRRIAEALALLAGNNEPAARVVGARELLRLAAPAATDMLSAVLHNSADPAAQLAACQAVADAAAPPPALRATLEELLASENSALRAAAAVAVARFHDAALIDRLAATAVNERLPLAPRLGCIDALAAMADDKRAIAALMTLIDSPNPELVIAALDHIDDSADADLPDVTAARDWWAANRDLDRLPWLERRNVQLRTRLRRADASARHLTTRLLAALRTSYFATPEPQRGHVLLDLLADPLADVRALGVELVDAIITDRRPVPAELSARVARMITDPSPLVRRSAAAVIGDLRDHDSLASLLAALAKEPVSRVRAAMVQALGKIGGPACQPALLAALDDPAAPVAVEAALALAALAEPGAPNADSGAVPAALLRRFQADTRPELREALLAAMARLQSPRFLPIFRSVLTAEAPTPQRAAAIRGLAAADPHAAAALRPLLADREAQVRLAAADALGRCGRDEPDLRALADRLDPAREPEESVRARAWESLSRLLRDLAPADQLLWADRIAHAPDKHSAERRCELLTSLEQQLAEQAPQDSVRIETLERLASAQLVLGRVTAAAACLEQVGVARATSAPATARDALRRAVDMLLADSQFAALRGLLDRSRTMTDGRDSLLDRESLAARLEAHIARRVSAGDATDLPELVRLLDDLLDEEFALPPERRQALDAARRDLAALVRRQQHALLLELLDGDVAQSRAAAEMLVAIGPAVVPELTARLVQRADAELPIDEADLRLVSVLRGIEPRWAGFDAASSAADRRRAIDELNTLRAAPPTTAPAPRKPEPLAQPPRTAAAAHPPRSGAPTSQPHHP